MEGKHGQRHPLFPNTGAELRIQSEYSVYALDNALIHAIGDQFKALFGLKKDQGYWKWFARNVASGSAAGASSLIFVYSLDFARTRLANDAKLSRTEGSRQFNGFIDVYKKTLASDGVLGLYRGFIPSVVGIVVYRGLYFGLYDSLSKSSFHYFPAMLEAKLFPQSPSSWLDPLRTPSLYPSRLVGASPQLLDLCHTHCTQFGMPHSFLEKVFQ